MRIVLAASLLGGVILFTFLILFFTRTEYVVIASGLDPAEASAVTSKLESLGIPWKDQDVLSKILVPKQDVSRARMELAVSVNTGNLSWADVFGSDSITMTAQTREQMFVQAQAAAIRDSIETITSVEKASVILQIPKDSNYFINNEFESRASVVLTMRGGQSLDETRVSGIVNLLIHSVKGLSAENITILDSTGRQLNNPNAASTGGFNASSQFDLKVSYEKKTQDDLTTFLDTIYGRGNVRVIAHVVLDFDQLTESHTIFNPPVEGEVSGLVRSATRIRENVNSDTALGVPGTDSNTGEATSEVEGNAGEKAYEKASETLNYELNETRRELVKAQGQVKELSIGVLLNTKALLNESLTDEHKQELMRLIATSVGTQTANISVVASAFPDPMEGYEVYTGDSTSGLVLGLPIWGIVVIALITLAAVVLVMIVLRRKRAKEALEAQRLEELAKQEAESKSALAEIPEETEDKGSPRYHIERFIDKNPEIAAVLLRTWLNE